MPNWDDDSPQLRKNLRAVLAEIVREAKARKAPAVRSAKRWQATFMKGLSVPDSCFVGAFRGERGLENIRVKVGASFGVDAAEVAGELDEFEAKLRALVKELDSMISPEGEPNADQLAAVIDLCAWAHAEWIRIHPFANGNGRTARLWANYLAIRYGLPPFIRLRPRPNSGYSEAGARAMQGDWTPTAEVFRRMFERFLADLLL